MIQEVEAAVGMAYVRDRDSLREGRLPVTLTRDLKTAQSEEVIVATQLDDLGREQEENEGSSTEESGTSSDGRVLPGMQGIFLKQVSRDLDLATAMKGGVKQDRKPSWSFTGRLSMPYGNKRGPTDPVTVADKSPEIADRSCIR
jgi:hypothetical protein